jgi:hypothetical protein
MRALSAICRRGRLAAAVAGLATSVYAQANFSFTYRASATSGLTGVNPNGQIEAAATAVGASTTVTLLIANNTNTSGSIGDVTVNGGAYKLVSGNNSQIGGGATAQIVVTFAPTSAGPAAGTLIFPLISGQQVQIFSFSLTGNALQPNLITSYIVQPAGNQVAVGNGGTLTFTPTNLSSTTTATLIVLNAGTGPGVVNSAAVTGDAFKITGLPLLPGTVQPNSDLRFNIAFTPTQRGTSTGALSLDLGGTKISIALSGPAVGANLSYTSTLNDQSTTLQPGAALTFPSTAVGDSVSTAIRVTNNGDANSVVGAVNVVGSGYSLANLPPVPFTIVPGSSFTFTLVFKPAASGNAPETLLLDSASFTLNGVGLGPSLSYVSVVGSTSTPIAANGTVVFPNTNVSATSTVSIVVSNAGNSPTTVSGVSVTGTGFTLPGLPQLPITLNSGSSLQFNVAFTATSAAAVTGTLQIDSFAVNLRGNGNPPPALSSAAFSSLPSSIQARQQPAVGLSIPQTYPLDLTGKLTLTFASDSFADDPAIQFASGGRTVNFTIPAGTTDAIFGSSKQVQFQAGTVAGVINVAASFAVASVDLTPNPAPAASMTVAAAPPQISNVQAGARTANSFEVLITGYSTPRQVSQIKLQFTGAAGSNLQTSNLAVNTDGPFSTWFQSTTGIGFGSQFTASVIVNVTGDVNAVQSVAVTASNSKGDSNTSTLSLR